MRLSFDLLKGMNGITKVIFICTLLLAFFIPLSFRFSIYIQAILFIGILFNLFNFKRTFTLIRNKNNYIIISLSIVYILYLIGIFNTENYIYGRTELESFLPFLIFPLLFFGLDSSFYSSRNLKYLKNFFIAGLLVSTLYSFGHSTWMYIQSGEKTWYYYEKIAETIKHPTYFSMYLTFAISILLNIENKFNKILNFRTIIYFLIILWFTLFTILLSSKAGLIALVMVLLIFGIKALFFDDLKVFHIIKTILVLSFMIVFYYLFPTMSNRMNIAESAINKTNEQVKDELNTKHDGSNVRLAIWNISYDLIKENYLVGYGTGDVKDVLEMECRRTGFTYGADRHFNCHNQFLQTAIALGIPGVIGLLYFLFLPLISAFKSKDFLSIALITIVLENCLFESIFERQYGIVFSVYFICMLFAFNVIGKMYKKKEI